MTEEDEVRRASDRFYEALNRLLNGDPAPMAEVWSRGLGVTTMHPIGGRERGWDQVWEVWQRVAKAWSNGRVTVSDLEVYVVGDLAYTTGIEHADGTLAGQAVRFDVRATNAYHREDGTWKMVHHHADAVPSAQQARRQLHI